ncbi:MAG: crossover junction endodeoxyribonuclease RuvC [Alphaproteobacteria bacterium]|jgi:crossover junction endodeoxyribonuclease RuvC
MRILGIDPGIRNTGWGVVTRDGSRLVHLANGVIQPDTKMRDSERLAVIAAGLASVIEAHRPDSAAIEEIFVARSAASALKLGMARGVAMMQCASAGLEVAEIAAKQVKKSVVGTGNADKGQVAAMVTRLLSVKAVNADAADALAIAIAALHGGQLATDTGADENGLSRAIAAALARDAGSRGGAT